MTEPPRQQRPRTRTLAELTLIVRPHWSKVRTFTDEERADAEAYAVEHGGTVELLG
ncbi:hypothetical protein [Mycolicibacterium mucogenicum]|uniref:Uncharacterized protein n=1 Tax=Mycolicibacterium mucogenicum DSM 44124 TaxID=1226753 RepID=A0A8E4W390_MYCMU|nr:hypothetical protein [Mycolicibacterium mucogenicum]KAB7761168.1 hypothetical protein MMUC44124_00745 [Mycolicibacterium mucogenicum DSM 44124]QPG69967.1 hypothetical protein C1S78_002755 [Mycolicibacterium mucogenicum DSM 44124]